MRGIPGIVGPMRKKALKMTIKVGTKISMSRDLAMVGKSERIRFTGYPWGKPSGMSHN